MESLFSYSSLKPGKSTEDNHDIDKLWSVVRASVIGGLAVLIVVYIAVLFFRHDLYLDSLYNCSIRINDDVLRGNPETIIGALRKIKTEKPQSYRSLCQYVSKIDETPCLFGTKDSKRLEEADTKGCFLKGTKTIFIKPERDETQTIIDDRAEILVKMAELSKKYWENQ